MTKLIKHRKPRDYTHLYGLKFGQLEILPGSENYIIGSDGGSRRSADFKCDCGAAKHIEIRQVTSKKKQSCGHWYNLHGGADSLLYLRWKGMKKRALNPSAEDFKDYKGRGITICDEWLLFENFRRDMESSFSPELELDRIDPDGNYEPSNCRWATEEEQSNNRRNVKKWYWLGGNYTVREISDLYQIDFKSAQRRLYKCCWEPERVVVQGLIDKSTL